nr:hypothetical protein [Phytoactinopolyspora endophytica]
MTSSPPSLDATQLGAYFALIEACSLLKHAVEQQLREAGDLSYVQFQSWPLSATPRQAVGG